MKKLFINLLALVALLSVGVINFSAVTYAQDAPPALVDPFATTDPDPADDDTPPALTLPVVDDPEPVVEDPEPVVEDPEPVVEEDPEPVVEDPAPVEEAPVEELHAAAAPVGNAYSGGTTAESGPGLVILGLGSLLGAAVLRRKRK